MQDDEKNKIINFLQDFGCANLKQLQILFDEPKNNFKDVLKTGFVNKKGDIFVHSRNSIDMKTIYALEVLCKYKGRYKKYYKEKYPVEIAFITNENLVYYVIVTDKQSERGIIKYLENKSQELNGADRLILLFEDEECLEKIKCKTEYIYCVYPNLRIITEKEIEVDEE